MRYYDDSRIKAENALYNIIFGGRSNGKSTAVCKSLIDDHMSGKIKAFGRVLRYITDARDDYMNAWFQSDYLMKYTKETYNKEIWYDGQQWFFIPAGADPYSKKTPRDYFGRVFILNTEYKYKSAQFPNINRLIMEEFVLLNSADYLPFEFELFMSLVSTINRDRTDMTVWLIGNTLNKANPYFEGLGINIDKLHIYPNQLRILRNRRGVKYAIEYAEMSYEEEAEIPDILKIDGNEIAFEGDFITDSNVYDAATMKSFLRKASPTYCATLVYKNNEIYLYKVRLTQNQIGFAATRQQLFAAPSMPVLVRLDNRLIDIDKRFGATVAYLKDIGFDVRLCVFDDEQIKYAVRQALRTY